MKVIVTVGVCVKNCEKDIKEIVERISNQDFLHKKIEVIFVDDGSKDNTLGSILEYAPILDMQFKVFHHTWKGLGFTRNVVLKNARGDYIVWVDDGTIIPRDYVTNLVNFMEKNPTVGIAKGSICLYSGSNYIAMLESISQVAFYRTYAGRVTTKLPGAGGSIYRVEAAKQVGGFDENITGSAEDADIAYRISSAGWQIFITNFPFSIDYAEHIQKIWRKNLWYGYGLHFFVHKHRSFRNMPYRLTPLAGFIIGLLSSFNAYRFTHKKIAFILPIYSTIRMTACFLGFINSHLDAYGHTLKDR